mmetsp:Transcript_121593/g.343995  ORF Transcript_121593/g.343995 Transcript_121593/m.343995 type:complete len:91 (+) Transcript_121593:3101-3373(+)
MMGIRPCGKPDGGSWRSRRKNGGTCHRCFRALAPTWWSETALKKTTDAASPPYDRYQAMREAEWRQLEESMENRRYLRSLLSSLGSSLVE